LVTKPNKIDFIVVLYVDLKGFQMPGMQGKWLSGLLWIGLAAFASAGCRSAQQFAKMPANPKPATQSTAPPKAEPAVKGSKSSVKGSAQEAKAKPAPDEQQLRAEAKQAATDTEKTANDLLTGLRQEIGAEDPYPPSGDIVNINYSSEQRILKLPGINHTLAMKIIRNRPYATPTDLMAKHVLNKEEYERIKDRLTAWDNLWNNPD
jgi:DNA uptake protein ComE-like DNA-binding protein